MNIEAQDDDAPVGRVLTRREVLTLLGAGTGAALLAACLPTALSSSSPGSSAGALASPSASASASGQAGAIPSCIVRPELTEGPYYVDEELNRSDIRSDPASRDVREGAALGLAFAVSRINGTSCTAFEGATVDVWHCDALGVYSDVQDPSGSTVGHKFLRGYQVTDATGAAAFTTIYPGWYRGRAVHIHFKVRTDSGLEFTSQLFLDDALTDTVHQRDPYAGQGQRDTRNADDSIFRGGGDQLLLDARQDGDGYAAIFQIGIQVA